MTAFLASLNYNAWILPVLLLLPVVGGALVLAGILVIGWMLWVRFRPAG